MTTTRGTTTPVPTQRGHFRQNAADSHTFPTRPYDLVKEFVIALAVVGVLSFALAAVFSSPDDKAITLSRWAAADPANVVATAAGELAGTTTSATYGAPYNHASDGQKVLGLQLQKWGGVRVPVSSSALALQPLLAARPPAPRLATALAVWDGGGPARQQAWSTAYADALAKAPGGDPAR